MRRLARPTPPARIDAAREDGEQRLRDWYAAPPRDRWNDKERGESPVREALRAMSGDRCAWCEAPLGKSLEVEHYLPQEHFPWLRYCWANLLPACGPCNGAKLTWHPEALTGRPLIDPCLGATHTGVPYLPHVELRSVEDRLVEPTVDEPAEHLTFTSADCTWTARTSVGRRTIAKLFSDRSYNERMQRLSELAHGWARDAASEEVIRLTFELLGHETVMRALIDYWRSFYPPTPKEAPF